jgi:hypothetical protein
MALLEPTDPHKFEQVLGSRPAGLPALLRSLVRA